MESHQGNFIFAVVIWYIKHLNIKLSSVDGNLNAQKLSNRARLVNSFDFVCTRDQYHSKLYNTNDSNNPAFKSPITTRRQQQILNIQKSIAQSIDPSSKNEFKLFAVVMHSGVSLNSGHYTAFVNYKIISQCENNDLGIWFLTHIYFFDFWI